MIHLLCWQFTALVATFTPHVEPTTAVAVAIGLAHVSQPAAKPSVSDSKTTAVFSDPVSRLPNRPMLHGEEVQVQAGPTCDDQACQLTRSAPRSGRLLKKRR